jgi:pimeloyl-ACP methyl ester carboxylesterase
MRTRSIVMIASLITVAAACSGSRPALPEVPDTIAAATDDTSTTTTTSRPIDVAEDATTTTGTTPPMSITPPDRPPPYEDIAIVADDGVILHGRLWEGGDAAVLFTHEFSHAYADGEPVNSLGIETLVPSTWALADAGFTVLALDFRGHGDSEASYSVLDSPLDMRAAYRYLTDRGHTTIVGMASGNSAPVMATVSATDPAFVLAGLGMLFTPLGETGFDAKAALEAIDEPVWLVGIDTGSFGGVTKRLEPSVQNLYERFIFPRVPSGVGFADVYGEEWLGRELAFVRAVTGS